MFSDLLQCFRFASWNIRQQEGRNVNEQILQSLRVNPKPVVTFDGKAMKEGVDYTLSYKNNKAVYGNQTPCVTVNGKGCFNCGSGGNYTGTFTGTYRIVKADIKSAKVTIPEQIYTGNEITLDKSQITVKLSGVMLNSEDYEIVRYDNNVKKGKASVTIKGKGNYGGTKTVKFTIGTKGFLWWWRK